MTDTEKYKKYKRKYKKTKEKCEDKIGAYKEKSKRSFKNGIKVGFYLAKNPRGSRPKPAPKPKFNKPKLPARKKKTRLGQLPPQKRMDKRTISDLTKEAKKRGIRITKPNGTRKTKKQLLMDILGSK